MPETETPAVKESFQELFRLQAEADPLRIASARWTYDLTVFTYGLAIGPTFTAANFPRTAVFFTRLNALVDSINTPIKNHFRAPHPFQMDPRVKRFVIADPAYGYPSYHAARCAVFEAALAELDPLRQAAFAEVTHRVTADRVFAGEHLPLSVSAGATVGRAIWESLLRSQTFCSELATLKQAEWSPPPASINSFPVADRNARRESCKMRLPYFVPEDL